MDEQKHIPANQGADQSSDGLKVIFPVYGETNLQAPFAHALKLAQASRGELEIVDVRDEEEATLHIGVRELLERWKILLPGAHRSDLEDIGLNIKKVVRSGNKRKEILRRMAKRTHDILVLGTEKYSMFPFLFRNLSEKVAASFTETILYIPPDGKTIINEHTGQLTLRTILLPVKDKNSCAAALEHLKRLLSLFSPVKPAVIGLHAGVRFPAVGKPYSNTCQWLQTVRDETLEDAILNSAKIYNPDLIIMPSRKKTKLTRFTKGTLIERVARQAKCPVLKAVHNS
ncbi:MAG: universal stress protein [Chitinispirillales bacterium]|nr:universal stress protein [Chitinispirillales bacterium]